MLFSLNLWATFTTKSVGTDAAAFTVVSRSYRQLLNKTVELKAKSGTLPSSCKYSLWQITSLGVVLVSWVLATPGSSEHQPSVPSVDYRQGQWSSSISPKPHSASPVTLGDGFNHFNNWWHFSCFFHVVSVDSVTSLTWSSEICWFCKLICSLCWLNLFISWFWKRFWSS